MRKSMDDKDQGFTLIELLVVMIIIGILASIAIPVFLSQRAKARDTSTKADVSTIGKEMATYYVDNIGAPPVIAVTGNKLMFDAVDVGNASNGTALATTFQSGNSATTWCVALTNPDGKDKIWKYSAVAGLAKGAC